VIRIIGAGYWRRGRRIYEARCVASLHSRKRSFALLRALQQVVFSLAPRGVPPRNG
jgi:hypothetical protein